MLKGLTVCCSGTLSVTRTEFEKLIKKHGGSTSASVTGKTTHLVTTPEEFTSETTKVKKAKHTGVPIVSEDFINDSILQKSLANASDYSLDNPSPQKSSKKQKLSIDERILDFYEKNRKKLIKESPNIKSNEIVSFVVNSWNKLSSNEQQMFFAPSSRLSTRLKELYTSIMENNSEDAEVKTHEFNCDCDTMVVFCPDCEKRLQSLYEQHFEEISQNQLEGVKSKPIKKKEKNEDEEDEDEEDDGEDEEEEKPMKEAKSIKELIENEEENVSKKYADIFRKFEFFMEFTLGKFWNDFLTKENEENIFSSSYFYVSGSLNEYPLVKVKDTMISIPFDEENYLSFKNPFGITGNSFEIAPSEISVKHFNLTNSKEFEVLEIIRKQLSPDCEKIKAELFKMDFFEKGSHYKRQKETKQNQYFFGTLIVFAPSFFVGGEIVLKHGKEERLFDFSMKENLSYNYLAFYNECDYEIKPLNEGYRIALTYHLYYDDQKYDNTMLKINYKIDNSGIFRMINNFIESKKIPTFVLSHQYPTSFLRPDQLKGRDLELYNLFSKDYSIKFVEDIQLNINLVKECEIPLVSRKNSSSSDHIIYPFFQSDLPRLKYGADIIKENDDESHLLLTYKSHGMKIQFNQKPNIWKIQFKDIKFHF
jgi:hypothetical protein